MKLKGATAAGAGLSFDPFCGGRLRRQLVSGQSGRTGTGGRLCAPGYHVDEK
jgi:hypothetical protein